METILDKAKQAWGDAIPNWVVVLAEYSDHYSQSQAAKEIRYTPAVVTQVLKKTYKGNLSSVEQAVKGAFQSATVKCPVMGDLPSNDCLENQRKPFSAVNPQRVQLFRACRGCENNRSKGEKS